MNDQGFGVFQFNKFLEHFDKYTSNFHVWPEILNLTKGNNYFLPYSAQPIYSTMAPLIFTIQIISGKTALYYIKELILSPVLTSCVKVNNVLI